MDHLNGDGVACSPGLDNRRANWCGHLVHPSRDRGIRMYQRLHNRRESDCGLPHEWRALRKECKLTVRRSAMAKQRRNYTREFKVEAVRRIAAEGKSLAEVARDLDIGETLLRSWKVALAAEGEQAFPGKGNAPRRRGGTPPPPRREPAAPHGARDLKKSDGLLRQGVVVRYRFIEGHARSGPSRLMCRVLEVSTAGYYAWRVGPPPPARSGGEALLVEIRAIHAEVKARYGSPRIHAELAARGHGCCVNTVAKLMRQAGDRGQDQAEVPLHHRLQPRPPRGRQRLDRQFEPEAPEPGLGGGHHVHPDARGLAVPGRRGGPVLAAGRGLVDGRADRQPAGGGRPGDGGARGGCRARGWWPTRTGAASTPASTTNGSLASTGSRAA